MAGFLTSGMRFLLNQKVGLFYLSACVNLSFTSQLMWLCIWHVHLSGLSASQFCPALDHAALVHVNSMLETIPVRTEVDQYIGIDYSLTNDPLVTSRSLDINFQVRVLTLLTWFYEDVSDIRSLSSLQGRFFELSDQKDTLMNQAVEPVISEYDRMVYLALSEFFFDSGMFSYYKAGIFQTDIVNEKVTRQHFLKIHETRVETQTVNKRHTPQSPSLHLLCWQMPKDLQMLLKTTYFGTIMMLVRITDTDETKQIQSSGQTTKEGKGMVQTKWIPKKLCW